MSENSMNFDETMRSEEGASLGNIDQYNLVSELGGGGFGTVYLARDTVSGIDVAVKGLPPIVKASKEELENIRRNFALVSRLHHPNIAAALTLHPAKEARYSAEDVRQKLRVLAGDTLLVMAYASGVTLSSWRRQFPDGKVPMRQALEITRQIASALDYAHKEKVLHRDIKPANVMIETSPDGTLTARVLDFGLAAEIRSSMGRVSRQVCDTSGTRPYMAPEQWLGREQGMATDQYALAVLFHELVTGKVPFASVFDTGDSVLMMNVVGREAPALPAGLPKPVEDALVKALAKKPEERFASCMDFVRAVEGRIKVKSSGSAGFGASVGGLRISRPAIAVIALVAALGIGAGVWYRQDMKAKEAARIEAEMKAAEEKRIAEENARKAEEEAKRKAEDEKIAAERRAKAAADRLAEEKRRQEADAELAAFRMSSKAESAHDLIGCETDEVKAFFADEIREFETDRRSGDDAKAMSKNVIATNFYAKALASATALKISVGQYQECKRLFEKTVEAKKRADAVEAVKMLPDRWKEIHSIMVRATAELKDRKFADVQSKLQDAETRFVALRGDVVNAVLDAAEGHKAAGRWERCQQEADRVLAWDSTDPRAIALKNEALKHLVSSLKIVTMIDGEEVSGAKVKINGTEYGTPLEYERLEKGGSVGPYEFTYARSGKKFTGTFSPVTVDWQGLKVLSVALKENEYPASSSAKGGFFPVSGIVLGKTTHSEIVAMGGDASGSYADTHVSYADIAWWDHNKDGVIESLYTTHGDEFPAQWRRMGISWRSSYNEWLEFFRRNNFSINITEPPTVKLYSERKTLSADVEAVSETARLKFKLDFDYGNYKGEGYSTASHNSLYSITVNSIGP